MQAFQKSLVREKRAPVYVQGNALSAMAWGKGPSPLPYSLGLKRNHPAGQANGILLSTSRFGVAGGRQRSLAIHGAVEVSIDAAKKLVFFSRADRQTDNLEGEYPEAMLAELERRVGMLHSDDGISLYIPRVAYPEGDPIAPDKLLECRSQRIAKNVDGVYEHQGVSCSPLNDRKAQELLSGKGRACCMDRKCTLRRGRKLTPQVELSGGMSITGCIHSSQRRIPFVGRTRSGRSST